MFTPGAAARRSRLRARARAVAADTVAAGVVAVEAEPPVGEETVDDDVTAWWWWRCCCFGAASCPPRLLLLPLLLPLLSARADCVADGGWGARKEEEPCRAPDSS